MSNIEREASQSVRSLLQRFPCVAVLGARQVGKTTLLRQVLPDAPFFDLERQADMARIRADPDFFLSQWKQPIVLDEAQLCTDLFPALRVAIDANRGAKGRYLLSGSSSPALLNALTESLAGRIAILELGQFTLSEAWQRAPSRLCEIIEAIAPEELLSLQPQYSTAELLESVCIGGYPEPVLQQADKLFGRLWFDNYFATYINRDVRQLFPGLKIDTYQLFIQMLCAASGEIINAADFARSLDVSQPTVKSYVRIAEGTFLWRSLPSFSRNVAKRVTKMPKGYIRDSGLVCHLLRIRSADELRANPRSGRIWESFVTEKLLLSLSNRMISVEPHYYRTHHQAEVDLVLEGDFGLLPIEIKLGTMVDSRRLRALQDFVKEQRCPYGLVISNAERAAQLLPSIYEIPAGCL